VEFPIKRVIYRLAERSLLGNLGQVYVGANQMLEARGFHQHPLRVRQTPQSPAAAGAPAPAAPAYPPSATPNPYAPGGPLSSSAPPPPTAYAGDSYAEPAPQLHNPSSTMADAGMPMPQGTWAGADAGGLPGPAAAIAWPSGMNPSRLLDALSQVSAPAAAPAQPVYSDSQLATDMASALDALAQGRQINTWIPPANLALAGQMFDTLYQDHRLHEAFRPLLRRLQYPVMKTALSDPSFFTSPSHPVRNLVHDVFGMVSSLDSPSPQDIKRLTDLIEHLTRQFEVDSERFAIPEARAPSVNETEAEQFLAEQKQRMADHRARTLKMVRRLVAQELKIRTADRDVPEGLMPLLLSGFGPMLAVNALRGGVSGTPWKESIDLLERMLDSISSSGTSPNERHLAEQADIIINITERLTTIGLDPEKVQRLVGALVDHYDELARNRGRRAVAAQKPAAPPPEKSKEELQEKAVREARQALSAILMVGSWFQVWDATNSQQRWLKLHAYFPTIDAVVFDDFMGENHLKLNASNLIRDFIKGLSAPVDPSAAVQRALKLLEPLVDMLPPASEAPVWQPATETMH
ncbi:MAG TPA: DUF1631 family protein, partial [Nevskiaceae bacterium]|nr:DUF1631 family protein [Nevskiaceae bacterium]